MTPRIFIEPPCLSVLTLKARQSHHLVRVLRLGHGSAVEVFDGTGRVWQARVSDANVKACRIERGALVSEQALPAPQIHLAQALLKGDAMDRLLRQATELGVAHIWPLTSDRTQQPALRAAARQGHWRRIVTGACEQSRRPHLPTLHDSGSFAEFIDNANPPGTLLLHPCAEPLPTAQPVNDTTLLVGPEGGWSPGEVDAAIARGIPLASLGKLILRAETTPIAAIAAIRHSWNWR